MTIGVPIVTCLYRVRRIHKAAQTPLPCETCITCVWAVATTRRPWAGLTVCVYMDVHASGSRSLPRAATLSSSMRKGLTEKGAALGLKVNKLIADRRKKLMEKLQHQILSSCGRY